MAYKTYCFKFYLNSRHSLSPDDIHGHTWELVINVINYENKYIVFNELERTIANYLEYYENQYLNEIIPFDRLLPIMENMGDVFAYDLYNVLGEKKIYLSSLAISENPTRTYILENDGDGFENPLEIKPDSEDVIELQHNADVERMKQRLGTPMPTQAHNQIPKKRKWNPFANKN